MAVTWKKVAFIEDLYGLAALGDPGADRIAFWDDSETALKWLSLADELSITTTTLSVDHDLCTNFAANEHIDWTNAAVNFLTSGTIGASTAKLSNLTDDYVPYHVSDAAGLANSPMITDATNINIGTALYTNNATLSLYKGAVATPGTHATSALNFWHGTVIGDIAQMTFGYNAWGVTKASAYIGYVSINQTSLGYGDLVFGTRNVNTDTQPSERVRITSAGLVGIGKTPASALDVNGEILTTNLSIAGNHLNIATPKTPASAGAAGQPGDMCADGTYVYVCVSSNTWKRIEALTW